MRRRPWLWPLCVAAVAALWPGGSFAFVRSVDKDQHPKYWATACVTVEIFTNGFSQLPRDEVIKSVAAAAEAWGPSQVLCSSPDAGPGGPPSLDILPEAAGPNDVAHAALDFHNVVAIETAGWRDRPDALALTITSTDGAGRIVDARAPIRT